jgi:subtilisin family serine protease
VAKKKQSNSEPVVQTAPEKIDCSLDPKLQELILDAASGRRLDPASVEILPDGTAVVDVLAKLHDPAVEVPGLNAVRRIGQIVTGTVAVDDIAGVRKHPNLVSLKRAVRMHRQLDLSVDEINATQHELIAGLAGSSYDGAGVIVGIVDYGCDFKHLNFRHPDGKTRLLYLWDQRGAGSAASPPGFHYGREFDAAAINRALDHPAPYIKLGYNPGRDSHGTHVMDIAAGNGAATGRKGVAPAADLIFVQIEPSLDGDDESSGNARLLLDAVDYIFSKAAALGRPAVVNVSLGRHAGPHDGTTLIEQGLDKLLETSGRAICMAAGNFRERGAHASGAVSKTGPISLGWRILPGDTSRNEMEIWYPGGGSPLSVSLITPAGVRFAAVALGTTVTLGGAGGQVAGRIYHRAADPNNGDHLIEIFLEPTAPPGDWRVELTTVSAAPVTFHAWIERDDGTAANPNAQSRFLDPNPACSLASNSCGFRTIAVGAYLSSDGSISPMSSEGPTRDGRQKPEISAPGQWLNPAITYGIQAARSGSQESIRLSGTSMASPHVAGVVALLMQAAPVPLTAAEIKNLLAATARRAPGVAWHGRFGFGRIDALAALRSLLPSPVDALAAAPPFASDTTAAEHPTEPPAPDHVQPAPPMPETSRLGADGDASLPALIAALAAAAAKSGAKVRLIVEVEPPAT